MQHRISNLNDYSLFGFFRRDLLLLSFFTILVTYQPFTLVGEIYPFELGLYSSGIDSILQGLVPYRDFFHLRGPLEIFLPALLTKILGRHFYILPYYFYIGTVLTLLGCLWIGKSLYRSRLIFYLAGLVIVTRTFPRVYFNFWGGLRYAFGIFCLGCLVKYFSKSKPHWMFWAGVFAAGGWLTSVEIGTCALAGSLAAVGSVVVFRTQKLKTIVKSGSIFLLGFLLVVGTYVAYALATHSLGDYWQAQYTVATNMTHVFDDRYTFVYPNNIRDVLWGFTPFSPHFKHFTPVYTYIFLIGYLTYKWKKKQLPDGTPALIGIAAFGLVMYVAAWRKIENAQFEMALQPSKLLMFFMIEQVYFKLLECKKTIGETLPKIKVGIQLLIALLVACSLGGVGAKLNNRFVSVKIGSRLLAGKDTASLNPCYQKDCKAPAIDGWEGAMFPREQTEEFEQLAIFFHKNTKANEIVFAYPQYAFCNYVVSRPFLGRFPMADFSWLNDRWHAELIGDFRRMRPKYIVTPKLLPPLNFENDFFQVAGNRQKYDEMMGLIQKDYTVVQATPLSQIWQRKVDPLGVQGEEALHPGEGRL